MRASASEPAGEKLTAAGVSSSAAAVAPYHYALSPDEATFLKRVAWETVETWRRGEPSGSAVAAPDEAVAELPDMPACVTGTETCGTRSPSA